MIDGSDYGTQRRRQTIGTASRPERLLASKSEALLYWALSLLPLPIPKEAFAQAITRRLWSRVRLLLQFAYMKYVAGGPLACKAQRGIVPL